MKDFADIIDHLGGSAAAARVLQTTQQNVWQMKERNNIPPKYWPHVVGAIEGVTLEKLASLAIERGAA